MNYKFIHNNFNVLDLDKSIKFYEKALGLKVVRESEAKDGSFKIAFLSEGNSEHLLELTWLRDWENPYDLGDNEFHLALEVDDFAAAHKKHEDMGIIVYENPAMGIYFISDPDEYWIEIVPNRE